MGEEKFNPKSIIDQMIDDALVLRASLEAESKCLSIARKDNQHKISFMIRYNDLILRNEKLMNEIDSIIILFKAIDQDSFGENFLNSKTAKDILKELERIKGMSRRSHERFLILISFKD